MDTTPTLTAQWQAQRGRFVITRTADGESTGGRHPETAARLALEHLAGEPSPSDSQVASVVDQLEDMKRKGRGGVLDLADVAAEVDEDAGKGAEQDEDAKAADAEQTADEDEASASTEDGDPDGARADDDDQAASGGSPGGSALAGD